MATRKDPPELDDPSSHFPYKIDEVRALLDDNPPAGPDGPDDDRVRVEDFITPEIAAATDAYVQAQADYYRDQGEATYEVMQSAAADLVAARRAHRANRPAGPTVIGIRARRSGE